jgi:hypothetical protein
MRSWAMGVALVRERRLESVVVRVASAMPTRAVAFAAEPNHALQAGQRAKRCSDAIEPR